MRSGSRGVVEECGEGARQSELFIELTEGEESGIGGELCRGGFDDKRCAEEIEGVLPNRLYTHGRPLGVVEGLVGSTS